MIFTERVNDYITSTTTTIITIIVSSLNMFLCTLTYQQIAHTKKCFQIQQPVLH